MWSSLCIAPVPPPPKKRIKNKSFIFLEKMPKVGVYFRYLAMFLKRNTHASGSVGPALPPSLLAQPLLLTQVLP